MNRRSFLASGPAMAGVGILGGCATKTKATPDDLVGMTRRSGPVSLEFDGLNLEPTDYAYLLTVMTGPDPGLEPDSYSRGGAVEALEQKFAAALGKERAIFMPTGTLANHMAMRILARESRRVVVQAESHIYNDTGDAAQTLSGLNVIPLGQGSASFTAAELEATLARTASGRVATGVGAVAVETPVRRRNGELFDPEELARVVEVSRKAGARLHLDGARLFIAAAYTGTTPAAIAAPFDTVYVSLYKCFNAASGAILAGPASLIDGLFHMRRMFGGGMPQAWMYAAIASAYLDGYLDGMKLAIATMDSVISNLEADERFKFQKVERGTNVIDLDYGGSDPEAFRENLRRRGVVLRAPAKGTARFTLRVNETLNRSDANLLTLAFRDAAS